MRTTTRTLAAAAAIVLATPALAVAAPDGQRGPAVDVRQMRAHCETPSVLQDQPGFCLLVPKTYTMMKPVQDDGGASYVRFYPARVAAGAAQTFIEVRWQRGTAESFVRRTAELVQPTPGAMGARGEATLPMRVLFAGEHVISCHARSARGLDAGPVLAACTTLGPGAAAHRDIALRGPRPAPFAPAGLSATLGGRASP